MEQLHGFQESKEYPEEIKIIKSFRNSMTIKTFIIILTICFSFAFVSCNKASPAGFWKNYKTDFLIINISDQGPYGGHRAIHWKADDTHIFNSKNVIVFARKNGWQLIDSSYFSKDQTNKWIYNSQDVFPLTGAGFSDTLISDGHLNDFPRWFSGPLTVYKFQTGWVTIDPGTDSSIEENGFVIINQDKTEMAVYHLWGE